MTTIYEGKPDMSREKITVGEKFPRSQVEIIYQIDTVCHVGGLHWRPLLVREMRHEGKFAVYHKDFRGLAFHTSRVFTEEKTFAFSDEATALALAKLMTKIWEMPLRVMKVQKIRVQTQCGKILVPNGGM